MNEPDIIMYSPEQLRYARETLAYRAPEVMTDDERLLLRAATRAPGAPALINPPEVCRAAVDALAASRAPLDAATEEELSSFERLVRAAVGAGVSSLLAAESSRATPRTTDPAEWARHNQQAGPGCVVPAEPERPLELAPHEVASPVREPLTAVERFVRDVRAHLPQGGRPAGPPLELAPHEVDSPVRELLIAVERAASELHGQGAKSDRIALQLLAAIARFEAEVGQ